MIFNIAALLSRDLLLKERISSSWRKFFPLRVEGSTRKGKKGSTLKGKN